MTVLDNIKVTAICHSWCTESSCKFNFINNLNLELDLYYDHLQNVFFKKENMREKESWWLSAFYSFCIQSMVLKGNEKDEL